MIRSLTTAATGMTAQQINLDTIANNLANVNTNGFKGQRAEFQDLVYQTLGASGAATGPNSATPSAIQVGLGTRLSATATMFQSGPMQSTSNPTDLAIGGEGFFRVTTPDGKTAYTRDGSFKRDVNGAMVTSDGYLLADDITIPSGATGLSVSSTGAVTATLAGDASTTEIGKIQLAMFTNPSGLTRIGNNLFTSGGASGDPSVVTPGDQGSGRLQSSFLEGSNVQVVDEMVRMITAQRAYEINSKAITTSDEMLTTVNALKR